MKETNKIKLAQVVQEILLNEQEALAQEITQLKEKIDSRDKKIQELQKENSSLQSVKYEYAQYKGFYYTHFGICPHCVWHGWWDDGHGGWWGCDLCQWNWELELEVIQKVFQSQIENELKSKQ